MINKFDKERFDAMGRDAMSRVEEIVNATKLNDLLHRKEEEDKKKNCILWVLAIIGAVGVGVGLAIAPIVSDWMDVCSIYICPIGALLAGVMFFWVCGKDYVLEQVNLSRSKPLGRWFYPMAKYLFCGVTLLVLILGAIKGGIG